MISNDIKTTQLDFGTIDEMPFVPIGYSGLIVANPIFPWAPSTPTVVEPPLRLGPGPVVLQHAGCGTTASCDATAIHGHAYGYLGDV